jgi:hypothetical protein
VKGGRLGPALLALKAWCHACLGDLCYADLVGLVLLVLNDVGRNLAIAQKDPTSEH